MSTLNSFIKYIDYNFLGQNWTVKTILMNLIIKYLILDYNLYPMFMFVFSFTDNDILIQLHHQIVSQNSICIISTFSKQPKIKEIIIYCQLLT